MIRTLAPLVVAGAVCAAAAAQPPVIRHGSRPMPAGVISSPSLPIAGGVVGGVPSPTTPVRPLPRPFLAGNPYYWGWGGGYYYPDYYWPWPDMYNVEPTLPYTYRAAQFAAPVTYVTPTYPTVVAPAQPTELRARLAITVPMRARVWIGDREIDANAKPLVVESPPLQAGQSYTFDVKVTWPENGKTEERTRAVTVGAGEQTSLTYQF
jgi:uncharacterized protein (TIGR03000 family)